MLFFLHFIFNLSLTTYIFRCFIVDLCRVYWIIAEILVWKVTLKFIYIFYFVFIGIWIDWFGLLFKSFHNFHNVLILNDLLQLYNLILKRWKSCHLNFPFYLLGICFHIHSWKLSDFHFWRITIRLMYILFRIRLNFWNRADPTMVFHNFASLIWANIFLWQFLNGFFRIIIRNQLNICFFYLFTNFPNLRCKLFGNQLMHNWSCTNQPFS